jgi:predicted membrane protein
VRAQTQAADQLAVTVVVVAIVVSIVPITFGMPALIMFVPPSVVLIPTVFSSLVQLSPLVVGLAAVAAVFFDRLMQLVFRMLNAATAAFIVIGMKAWHGRESEGREQRGCRQQ